MMKLRHSLKLGLLGFLSVSILFSCEMARATACSYKTADGSTLYRQNTNTKTLGEVARIKPCPDQRFIITYPNWRGMRLITNPIEGQPLDCRFLTVLNGSLATYDGTVIDSNGMQMCDEGF